MKKSFLAVFLIAVMISGSAFVGTMYSGTAQSGTNINGSINNNTTWTQANSPYTLTGNVFVNNGVNLTIDAGVAVNLGSYNILVNGILQAWGNYGNPVTFNGGQITFAENSTGWNPSTGSGSIIVLSVLSSSMTLYDSALISDNIITGGVSVEGDAMVSNNTIMGQGISVVGSATVSYNTISGCSIGISLPNTSINPPLLMGNLIVNNTEGIQIVDEASNGEQSYNPVIQNNTITNNTVGISLIEQSPSMISPIIMSNNIYSNTNYNINSGVSYNINAAYNWWGTTNTQIINQTIYDFKDNSTSGTVSFVPFLDAPNHFAPTYIESSAGAGGSISPSGYISVNYGGSQTFNITPTTGYSILDVLVNGTSVGAVSSYTVQNIQGATTISATFAPNGTPTPNPTAPPITTPTPTPTSAYPSITLNPSMGPAGTEVTYTGNGFVVDANIYLNGQLVTTVQAPSGSISGTLQIPATATPGTYTIQATDAANQQATADFLVTGSGSSSPTPSPTPTPTPASTKSPTPSPTPAPKLPSPNLSFYCISSTTTSGFNVQIQGSLTYDGVGLSGAGIQLSDSVTGGATWQDLAYVNTGDNGSFSVVWLPSASGNDVIKATWSGNYAYSGVSAVVNFAVAPFDNQGQNVFSVTSNSTLTSLTFDSTTNELSFSVSGPSGTTGLTKVCIPQSLIPDISKLNVMLDGASINYTSVSQGNVWLLTFTYHHSSHTIVIALGSSTSKVPEFPSFAILSLFLMLTVSLSVALTLRNRKKDQAQKELLLRI